MSWTYKRTEPQLYTVGRYDPAGKWHPDSDHESSEDAAARCHYLNGGVNIPRRSAADPKLRAALQGIINAANANPDPCHYKIRAAIDAGRLAVARTEEGTRP